MRRAKTTQTVSVRGKTVTVIPRRMTKLFGRTYWIPKNGKGKMLVDGSLRGVPRLSTILHEMLHHLNWGLSETRVMHLEYGLVAMVLANPDLFAELAAHGPRKPRAR